MNPEVLKAGSQLAIGLAQLYLPGAGPVVTGLGALIAAITELNRRKGRPADWIPTVTEINEFIAEREARRIPV